VSRLTAPDVVGVTEVASIAGVSRKTVASWVRRGSGELPPHTSLAAGPVWSRRQILAWSEARLAREQSVN
jgi:predicted DNA-binding transcriptional regulator AlpA